MITRAWFIMTTDDLYDYQRKAVNYQCNRPNSALWLDMGLGKTVITLTSIAHLLKVNHLRGVLIVAPIKVTKMVWRQEALKWNHTSGLTFSVMVGNKDQRTRALLRCDLHLGDSQLQSPCLKCFNIRLLSFFLVKKMIIVLVLFR